MVQECVFHVSPLFGIKFLQDCYKFLQIQSHITTLHYLHNISGGVNVLYLKKSTVQQIFQNSISQNIKCMEIDGLPSPGYKKCSHITHFIANYTEFSWLFQKAVSESRLGYVWSSSCMDNADFCPSRRNILYGIKI